MKLINTQHPEWTAFWNSPIEFVRPTPEVNAQWPELEGELLEFSGYDRAWLFTDTNGGQYVVALDNGLYGTLMMGGMGSEAKHFPTLEDAAKATFGDWFPEGSKGEYNVHGDYVVDGQWLIWGR